MTYLAGQTFGRPRTHGHCGYRSTKTYTAWTSMRRRCNSPRVKCYPDYGGRGIKVCERWNASFAAFLEDMGEAPPGTYLDRINNDGDYEAGNCRWSTPLESGANRRGVRLISGVPLKRYAALNGVCRFALATALCRGLTATEAVKLIRERQLRRERSKSRAPARP